MKEYLECKDCYYFIIQRYGKFSSELCRNVKVSPEVSPVYTTCHTERSEILRPCGFYGRLFLANQRELPLVYKNEVNNADDNKETKHN